MLDYYVLNWVENFSMTRTFNSLVSFVCLSILFVSGIGCAPEASSPTAEKSLAIVQKGNLSVSVYVDGNLVMPQAFDLLFGAPGDVKEVLVEEGDFVREGTVLAWLDNTSQRLDVQSSNNNVQTVLSNLYEIVPLLPQFPSQLYETTVTRTPDVITTVLDPVPIYDPLPFPHRIVDGSGNPAWGLVPRIVVIPGRTITTIKAIPNTLYSATSSTFYYPNATGLASFDWAQNETLGAYMMLQADNYTAAASELYVALSDLEACRNILEYAVNDPKSGLGNIAPLVPEDEVGILSLQLETGLSLPITSIVELRQAVDSIKQGQADIEAAKGLIAREKYDEAEAMFQPLFQKMNEIGKVVRNNFNIIKSHNYSTIYGEDISLYLYEAAEEKLDAALKGIEKDGLDSPGLHDNLRIAQHYMQICDSLLGSNHYVLQHGLSLKSEQGYQLDLAKALVGLGNSKDNFLKTAILAPFDGTVVSVGVKKNDVLSAIDYGSKVAVQLVDTSQIKFEGEVDEIDILKIKTGQKVTISVDAVPDETFTGTVSFISPYGTAGTGGVVKFPVTIKLDPTDVALKGGLTATAEISIHSIEDALLVPLSAVTTSAEGSFVTVVDEATGKQEKRQVTLGVKNLQFAEVLSGLKEGDSVIVEEKISGAPIIKGFPGRGGSSR